MLKDFEQQDSIQYIQPQPSDINLLVKNSDPLNLDKVFIELPNINRQKDVKELIGLTTSALPSLNRLKLYSSIEHRAILRDIGMLAASIKKHGLEPRDHIGRLDEVLSLCGRTANLVPRDTVFTYGPWNPEGDRRRRFTELPEEELFIKSFNEGMSQLDKTVYSLLVAYESQQSGYLTIQSCKEANNGLGLMVDAIVAVKRNISPQIFTGELRPYFDPYKIVDENYLAPGGAQMPILLIDQIIWGNDNNEDQYRDYIIENIEYTPSEYRHVFQNLIGKQSLITKFESRVHEYDSSSEYNDAIHSLIGILNSLISFRSAHLVVAKDNFQLRTSRDLGSGGYRTDILEYLIDKTYKSKRRLVNLLRE